MTTSTLVGRYFLHKVECDDCGERTYFSPRVIDEEVAPGVYLSVDFIGGEYRELFTAEGLMAGEALFFESLEAADKSWDAARPCSCIRSWLRQEDQAERQAERKAAVQVKPACFERNAR